MGAVSSAEGVVDEHIGVGSELLSEGLVVLLLLGVETDVLKKDDISVFHGSNGSCDGLSDAVRDKGHWLAEETRRSLGRELLGALQDGEAVELVTAAATWKSPRALLAVTDRRLLWLLDDAISHRVHSLRWRDVVQVEHRLRRPLRRTAVLRVETKLGRRLEWAELRPETARAVARHVAAGAGLQHAR